MTVTADGGGVAALATTLTHKLFTPQHSRHGHQGRPQVQQEPPYTLPRVCDPEPCGHCLLCGYGVRPGPYVSGQCLFIVIIVIIIHSPYCFVLLFILLLFQYILSFLYSTGFPPSINFYITVC